MDTGTIEAVDPTQAAAAPAPATSARPTLAMWWALVGVALVFATASARLGGRGLATLAAGLSAFEWVALSALTAGFIYGEGVRALQRKYVPHVIRRVELLRQEPRTWLRLLAPLQALSLIAAPRPLLVRAWAGTAAIGAAVVVVRSLPQPWRGITDFAVAAALAWGTFALARAAHRAYTR